MIKKIDLIFSKSEIYNSKFVYIYSDFRFFFEKEKFSEKKIKRFLNLFLKKGITCIIPAFSYTTKGFFDVKKTKSKVGFLSNYILDNENFTRSHHPIFSYIAIGKNKNLLKKLSKSAFGEKSLHETLLNKKCYFLNFNRPLKNGNTLMHHIEQKNKVKYRYEKTFQTNVYENNSFIGKNFKAFVRKNMKNKFSLGTFNKVFKKIKNKKYFFSRNIGKMEILIYSYDTFYKDLDNLQKNNPKIFIKGKH